MRPALVVVGGLPALVLAPAAWAFDPRAGLGFALVAATALFGGLLPFHLAAYLRREPSLRLEPAILASAWLGGGALAATAWPGAPEYLAFGAVAPALALAAATGLALGGARRAGPSLRAASAYGPSDRAASALFLVGLGLLLAGAALPALDAPRAAGALLGAATAWGLAAAVYVLPRAWKVPRLPSPFYLSAFVLALSPLAPLLVVPAAALMTAIGLAPARLRTPVLRPPLLLGHALPPTLAGLALLVGAALPVAPASYFAGAGALLLAAAACLLLAPILANQTPRDPALARLAAAFAVASGLGALVAPPVASALGVVAGALLAWDLLPLRSPRRVCPPEAVIAEDAA